MKVLATGLQFPEGPAIGPDGRLYVTEIAGQRISVVDMDTGGRETFADCGGGPNGCAWGPDGALYICNNGGRWPTDMPSTANSGAPPYGHGTIQRVDPDGTITDLVTEADGTPINSPNDICFCADGGFYFTDPIWGDATMDGGVGSLCWSDMDGNCRRVHSGLAFPNGLGVTADGRFLIVCESMTGMMWGFKIEAPGQLAAEPKHNGNIGRRSIPDGFCFDIEGNMIIAGHQTNNLFVLAGSDGRPIETITLADIGPTNVCFGPGDDNHTIYVTSSDQGEVLAVEWRTSGMPLHA